MIILLQHKSISYFFIWLWNKCLFIHVYKTVVIIKPQKQQLINKKLEMYKCKWSSIIGAQASEGLVSLHFYDSTTRAAFFCVWRGLSKRNI